MDKSQLQEIIENNFRDMYAHLKNAVDKFEHYYMFTSEHAYDDEIEHAMEWANKYIVKLLNFLHDHKKMADSTTLIKAQVLHLRALRADYEYTALFDDEEKENGAEQIFHAAKKVLNTLVACDPDYINTDVALLNDLHTAFELLIDHAGDRIKESKFQINLNAYAERLDYLSGGVSEYDAVTIQLMFPYVLEMVSTDNGYLMDLQRFRETSEEYLSKTWISNNPVQFTIVQKYLLEMNKVMMPGSIWYKHFNPAMDIKKLVADCSVDAFKNYLVFAENEIDTRIIASLVQLKNIDFKKFNFPARNMREIGLVLQDFAYYLKKHHAVLVAMIAKIVVDDQNNNTNKNSIELMQKIKPCLKHARDAILSLKESIRHYQSISPWSRLFVTTKLVLPVRRDIKREVKKIKLIEENYNKRIEAAEKAANDLINAECAQKNLRQQARKKRPVKKQKNKSNTHKQIQSAKAIKPENSSQQPSEICTPAYCWEMLSIDNEMREIHAQQSSKLNKNRQIYADRSGRENGLVQVERDRIRKKEEAVGVLLDKLIQLSENCFEFMKNHYQKLSIEQQKFVVFTYEDILETIRKSKQEMQELQTSCLALDKHIAEFDYQKAYAMGVIVVATDPELKAIADLTPQQIHDHGVKKLKQLGKENWDEFKTKSNYTTEKTTLKNSISFFGKQITNLDKQTEKLQDFAHLTLVRKAT